MISAQAFSMFFGEINIKTGLPDSTVNSQYYRVSVRFSSWLYAKISCFTGKKCY